MSCAMEPTPAKHHSLCAGQKSKKNYVDTPVVWSFKSTLQNILRWGTSRSRSNVFVLDCPTNVFLRREIQCSRGMTHTQYGLLGFVDSTLKYSAPAVLINPFVLYNRLKVYWVTSLVVTLSHTHCAGADKTDRKPS